MTGTPTFYGVLRGLQKLAFLFDTNKVVDATTIVDSAGREIFGGKTVTTVIAAGESVSSTVDLGAMKLAGILMPDVWTYREVGEDSPPLLFAVLSFRVSADGEAWAEFRNHKWTGDVKAGWAYGTDLMPDLAGFQYLQIRSGYDNSPIVQVAERTLTLVLQ